MIRLAAVVAAVVAWLAFTAPPELGEGPWRHCDAEWNCYLTGDVPAGATIVWNGPQGDIP